MKDYIEGNNENGTKGEVMVGMPLREIMIDEASNEVVDVRVGEGDETMTADMYVSAMSVDALKLYLPTAWKTMPFSNNWTNSPVFQLSTTRGSIGSFDVTTAWSSRDQRYSACTLT